MVAGLFTVVAGSDIILVIGNSQRRSLGIAQLRMVAGVQSLPAIRDVTPVVDNGQVGQLGRCQLRAVASRPAMLASGQIDVCIGYLSRHKNREHTDGACEQVKQRSSWDFHDLNLSIALCSGIDPADKVNNHVTEMKSTDLCKMAHIATYQQSDWKLSLVSGPDDLAEMHCKILNRLLSGHIQLVLAKFGSFAVDNRFRQPASPLLTGSDSSQQKIQIRKRKHQWKQEP
jgi:hypothetical protein